MNKYLFVLPVIIYGVFFSSAIVAKDSYKFDCEKIYYLYDFKNVSMFIRGQQPVQGDFVNLERIQTPWGKVLVPNLSYDVKKVRQRPIQNILLKKNNNIEVSIYSFDHGSKEKIMLFNKALGMKGDKAIEEYSMFASIVRGLGLYDKNRICSDLSSQEIVDLASISTLLPRGKKQNKVILLTNINALLVSSESRLDIMFPDGKYKILHIVIWAESKILKDITYSYQQQ